MSFQVIESFTRSKTGLEERNEDSIFLNDDFCAVFDGATSKTSNTLMGKSSGRLTVELITDYMNLLKWDADGVTAIHGIQAMLCQYSAENHLQENGIYLCASGLIYSRTRHELWAVGDCQYAINGKVTKYNKLVDTLLSDLRAFAIHCMLLEGKKESDFLQRDEARSLMMGFLRKQRIMENADDEYGYSVFSNHGKIRKFEIVSIEPGSEVVLASDGYPFLKETLQESECALQIQLQQDPLCYGAFRSTKGLTAGNESFDDRSYLRFITD